jgi:hypothetical protein
MGAQILPGYEHIDGWHCGSTALRNACRYVGVELSEPICFGLGAGAGFFYLKSDRFSPRRIFNGRSAALVPPFFHHLGLPAQWHSGDELDWPAMRACLDDGLPVILLADIYYLPYYRSSTHFPGHVVLLVGYDKDAGLAYLSDTDRHRLRTVSLDALDKAMVSRQPPFLMNYNWREVRPFQLPHLRRPIRRALRANAKQMLRPADPILGLPALHEMAADLPSWGQLDDAGWCARFGYQVIERRGTGGGAFRHPMYSRFLGEAAAWLPELAEMDAAERMATIGERWTALALALKAASEGAGSGSFKEAGAIAREIAEREASFWRDLDGWFDGDGSTGDKEPGFLLQPKNRVSEPQEKA